MSKTGNMISGIEKYFADSFRKMASQAGIEDISLWIRSLDGPPQSMQAYPVCMIQAMSRDCSDHYYDEYRIAVAIALRGDDPEELEELGHTWEDIIKDAIDEDRTLGDAVISTESLRIDSSFVSGMYMIWAEMICSA